MIADSAGTDLKHGKTYVIRLGNLKFLKRMNTLHMTLTLQCTDESALLKP